jgi:nitrate reductase beta subunit
VRGQGSDRLFHSVDEARVSMRYLSSLFGAGEVAPVAYALRKQKAVRWFRRAVTVGDVTKEDAERMLREADCTPAEAEAIYQLTALCTAGERFVLPAGHREVEETPTWNR